MGYDADKLERLRSFDTTDSAEFAETIAETLNAAEARAVEHRGRISPESDAS